MSQSQRTVTAPNTFGADAVLALQVTSWNFCSYPGGSPTGINWLQGRNCDSRRHKVDLGVLLCGGHQSKGYQPVDTRSRCPTTIAGAANAQIAGATPMPGLVQCWPAPAQACMAWSMVQPCSLVSFSKPVRFLHWFSLLRPSIHLTLPGVQNLFY